MQLTGSQIVVECLKEQGVDTIFGYPGGAILNIYDELYRHQDEIRHVLTSHEQGASHAADGYARSTGKVGVCMATSGPGATNLVTGIATAYMDSVPMVDADHKVQLHCKGCKGSGTGTSPCIPDRTVRSSGTCSGGYRQECNCG